jgi:pimeloyl-ACP methyl ester carboxylesterase
MTAELYREVEGSGDPILLIHGNGANTRIWGRSADDLAATHRVIAYDRRGWRRAPSSDRSTGGLSTPRCG